jgi:uncharacterized protein YwgA
MDPETLVVGLVALNGGQLVSKIRLQKTIYLLDACGLGSGLEFEYAKFGPYSMDLARAADDAVDSQVLGETTRQGYHAVPYSVFSTDGPVPEALGDLSAEVVQGKLELLERYSSLELEIAATVVFLRENGFDEDAIEMAKQLKPLKATDARLERAQELIGNLGL